MRHHTSWSWAATAVTSAAWPWPQTTSFSCCQAATAAASCGTPCQVRPPGAPQWACTAGSGCIRVVSLPIGICAVPDPDQDVCAVLVLCCAADTAKATAAWGWRLLQDVSDARSELM